MTYSYRTLLNVYVAILFGNLKFIQTLLWIFIRVPYHGNEINFRLSAWYSAASASKLWSYDILVHSLKIASYLLLHDYYTIIWYLICQALLSSGAVSRFFEIALTACICLNTLLQTDYGDQEKIGILECRHECHEECVKKWLVVKNTCPICKSKALSTEKLGLWIQGVGWWWFYKLKRADTLFSC